jgi:hypothetical protein
MCGEEIALVEWQIKKQEGKLPWWAIFARMAVAGAPEIPRKPPFDYSIRRIACTMKARN